LDKREAPLQGGAYGRWQRSPGRPNLQPSSDRYNVRVVDIHCHILPGVDDGPRTLEESVAMARMAAASGTTDIVATPHANNHYVYDEALIEAKLADLRAAAGEVIRLHRGCDFHLTPENIRDALAAPAKYSVAGNGYLLVEFSDYSVPETAGDIFRKMLSAGLYPVVTHPERNPLLRERLELVELWVDQGCFVQVTALSVLGRFGKAAKEASDRLLRSSLVHFLASDAHDCQRRTPALDAAWKQVSKELGECAARGLLETNPAAALAGRKVERVRIDSRKKWFHL
jgi:protein-tyrosine phosphatase